MPLLEGSHEITDVTPLYKIIHQFIKIEDYKTPFTSLWKTNFIFLHVHYEWDLIYFEILLPIIQLWS